MRDGRHAHRNPAAAPMTENERVALETILALAERTQRAESRVSELERGLRLALKHLRRQLIGIATIERELEQQ